MTRPGRPIRNGRLGARARWGCRLALAAAALVAPSTAYGQDDEAPWDLAPYRVHVTLGVEGGADAGLAARLAAQLQNRVRSALRPIWNLELAAAANPAERAACQDPPETPWDDLPAELRAADKLMWLGVQCGPSGLTLTCREFDVFLRRWGPIERRNVPQRSVVAESCFRLLTDSFSPLARVDAGAEDGQARLALRGGALPRATGPDLLTEPGDVFLPLFRRTGRGGVLVEDGVTPLPWTFLVTEAPSDTGWTARVDSALRQPLAGRRRASIEQVAIGLPRSSAPVRVRFFARSNRDQGLAGYEVFRETDPQAPPELVGLTDKNGLLDVPLGEAPTATLLLRSDGQVLAKLVVAAGAVAVVEAPIADDTVRLAAQGEVQAVREELVDIVARRAILIARIEALLKDGKADEARPLMDELSDLPTASMLRSRIDGVAARLRTSDDPRVRQTIDGQFTATRDLLARFLDGRVLTDLQARLNEALRKRF